ncbi:hypothetical protein [Massilia pseudoviolaceinigra]|uniref:hypothetical protein n=1 Tax=Massilia pseudoviolaceinigra TaxID=3057165 RepID=UPI0027965646|nr:hypothetical protein [Massilia sp. CCM 9206]MDQ1918927.1 hypothetical protein [Massilia sp. CCM 9206]
MELLEQLAALEEDVGRYDDIEFGSEEEGARANRRLKLRMRDLIVAAHGAGQVRVLEQALDLLSANTGCADDHALFLEIGGELTGRGIVDEARMAACLRNAPVNRWL